LAGVADGQAFCLNDLGIVHQRQGRYEEALDCQRRSLAIRRELGDARCEAESLRELGVTLRALGRPQEARTHWLEALAFLEQIQSADADQVRVLLAELPTGSSH
jgi:tetratricopeptide (TPR) repeat protein